MAVAASIVAAGPDRVLTDGLRPLLRRLPARDEAVVRGGPVRTTAAARHRQSQLHELVAWRDRFGVSGCAGCGCGITSCPTGIDIREAIIHG